MSSAAESVMAAETAAAPRTGLARLARALPGSRLGRWWRYECTLVVYRADRPDRIDDPAPVEGFGRNCRAHLERFVSNGRHLGREAFLRICEQRLAAGEQVYTVCPGDRLLAYAWLVPNQERSWLSAIERELTYPPRSSVLYNAYTQPEARGRGYNTLLARARTADAFLRFGSDTVFTSIVSGNVPAERAKLATGFRPWLELTLRTRLGRRVRGERQL